MTNVDIQAAEPPPAAKRRRLAAKLIVLGALIAALVVAAVFLPVLDYLVAALEWVKGLGVWGPVFVAGFYVIACVLLLPGGVITICAGFLFGLVVGTVTVSIGSTLGVCAAFLVGRTLARGWVEEKVAKRPKFAAIDEAVGQQGFKIVLLTRLNPIFPFNLQNYAYGLTKVKFGRYALASWMGMLPGTIVYVYIGSAARSLTDAAAGEVGGPIKQISLWVGLALTIVVVAFIGRIARKAIRQAVGEGNAKAAEGKGDA